MEKKNESLKGMVQTLEQQLQQQKSRADKLMANWQSCEDGWRHACREIQTSSDKWEAENQYRKFYIWHLAIQIREAAHEA